MALLSLSGGLAGAAAGSWGGPIGIGVGFMIGATVGGEISNIYQANKAKERAEDAQGYLEKAADTTDKIAGVSGQLTGLQNSVLRKQFDLQKQQRMQDRRNLIRQNVAQQSAIRFAGVTSGMYRGTALQAILSANEATTARNVQNIDKSLEIGQQITNTNIEAANLQGQIADLQGTKAMQQSQAQLAAAPDPSTSWI